MLGSSKKKICIIDFDSGNIGSLVSLFEKLSVDYCVSRDDKEIEKCSHLILPGVGSFSAAIKKIKQKVNISLLEKEVLVKKKPILGICVGMQLMANVGHEFGKNKGLGWVKGSVKLIQSKQFNLPHIGWNSVKFRKENLLFTGLRSDCDFYFVNSYCFNLDNQEEIIASTFYGQSFASIINKDNIYGVQFHPEKSHEQGTRILLNFYKN